MIALTVVGGYLGSGKTTLLNEILDRTDGERVAVVVNDFGTVNIDAEVIGDRDGSTWEIANGCICCDLTDGMAAAIESIRCADPPVTRAFVEVSGVGQPDVVARWGDHPGFSRGGAIVCADVTSIRRDTARKWVGDTVASQLRGADRLLLTKTDLATPEQVAETTEWLISLPGVDAEVVDRSCALDGMLLDDSSVTGIGQNDGPYAAAEAGSTHSSWSITTDGAVDPDRIRELFHNLPADFVRAKGVVRNASAPERLMLVNFDGVRTDIKDFGHARGEAGRIVLIAAGARRGTPQTVTTLAQVLNGTVDLTPTDTHTPAAPASHAEAASPPASSSPDAPGTGAPSHGRDPKP